MQTTGIVEIVAASVGFVHYRLIVDASKTYRIMVRHDACAENELYSSPHLLAARDRLTHMLNLAVQNLPVAQLMGRAA